MLKARNMVQQDECTNHVWKCCLDKPLGLILCRDTKAVNVWQKSEMFTANVLRDNGWKYLQTGDDLSACYLERSESVSDKYLQGRLCMNELDDIDRVLRLREKRIIFFVNFLQKRQYVYRNSVNTMWNRLLDRYGPMLDRVLALLVLLSV